MRAPSVVSIYLIDTVTCKEGGLTGWERSKGKSREDHTSCPLLALAPTPFTCPTNTLIRRLPSASLTRIKADVCGGAGCQEGYSQWPAQSLLIIEDLKLIYMSMAKELTSQGVLIPGQKTQILFKKNLGWGRKS